MWSEGHRRLQLHSGDFLRFIRVFFARVFFAAFITLGCEWDADR